MLQFASVTCDPPLGLTTSVPFDKSSAKFTVCVESNNSSLERVWQVVLWHNGHENRQWHELGMREITGVTPLSISTKSPSKVHRRYFTAELPRPRDPNPVNFTLKYRIAEDWEWANDDSALGDGELCFQPQTISDDLLNYFRGTSSDVTISPESSDCPAAKLWSIKAPIGAAKGDESTWTEINLGVPRDYTRWFALIRPWTPWVAPHHGKAPFSLGNDTVLLAFQRWDGSVVVLLAISGVNDVLNEMKSGDDGTVVVHSRNDRADANEAYVVAAVAPDFESANAACIYHARKLVKGYRSMNSEMETEIKTLLDGVTTEQIEDWHDGLTYCTWNALGQQLSEKKIFHAVNDLKEANIKITNLIIDDNWQSLDDVHGPSQWNLGWSEFEANKENFPQGLKHTVMAIREKNPNIKHIAVWHALLGYWNGIDPNGKIAKEYKTKTVPKDGGGEMTVVDADDIARMYNDFYNFLLSSGVDGVKTDAQYFLDVMHAAPDRRRFMNKVQDVWHIAILRHFGIKAISCMSLFPQNIFHSMLPTNMPRMMIRNSDDFFPNIDSSHPWHIFVNAHNALLTCHLNILPDWDMFQTQHEHGRLHAVGRCISGGPIYITDTPGKHDFDLINEMTAPTTRGQTIILRPSVMGKTVTVFTSFHEEKLLKVAAFHGGTGGTSLLGVFNVSQRTLSELVNIKDFSGVQSEEEYIVRAHSTGNISNPLAFDSQSPVVSLELPVRSAELLSAYPVHAFTLGDSTGLRSSATKVAVLGLLGKITGAAAVTSSDLRMQGGRLRIQVGIKALGTLGIYVSTAKALSIADDVIIMIQGKVIPVETVHVSKHEPVVEIDVPSAWEKMGLEPGYANDVSLEIWIR